MLTMLEPWNAPVIAQPIAEAVRYLVEGGIIALSGFGLTQVPSRSRAIRSWTASLTPSTEVRVGKRALPARHLARVIVPPALPGRLTRVKTARGRGL